MTTSTWPKSSDELRERFESAIAGVEGLEQRTMFGLA